MWLDSLFQRRSRETRSTLDQVAEDVRQWKAGDISELQFASRVAGRLGVSAKWIDPNDVDRVIGRWRLGRYRTPQAEQAIRELFEEIEIRTGGQHTPEVQS